MDLYLELLRAERERRLGALRCPLGRPHIHERPLTCATCGATVRVDHPHGELTLCGNCDVSETQWVNPHRGIP